jgi:hypothetical protein
MQQIEKCQYVNSLTTSTNSFVDMFKCIYKPLLELCTDLINIGDIAMDAIRPTMTKHVSSISSVTPLHQLNSNILECPSSVTTIAMHQTYHPLGLLTLYRQKCLCEDGAILGVEIAFAVLHPL